MTTSDQTPPEQDFQELVKDATRHEPGPALSAIGELRRWLADLEEDAVLRARVEMQSWEQIANQLGRSKQSVWEKYRDPDPRDVL